MTQSFESGVLHFAQDLADNIATGDRSYLSMLDAVDAYIDQNGLDLPPDPAARVLPPDPQCVISPVTALRFTEAGITSIIWATGYGFEFGWLEIDVFDERGRPIHERGVSKIPGLYFLGLPWLTNRASAFLWGVWHDSKFLADQIIARGRASSATEGPQKD